MLPREKTLNLLYPFLSNIKEGHEFFNNNLKTGAAFSLKEDMKYCVYSYAKTNKLLTECDLNFNSNTVDLIKTLWINENNIRLYEYAQCDQTWFISMADDLINFWSNPALGQKNKRYFELEGIRLIKVYAPGNHVAYLSYITSTASPLSKEVILPPGRR